MPWAEIVAGVVALVIALVGGGFGWQQVRAHGREKELRKSVEEERDEADQIIAVLTKAAPSPGELARAAGRELRRRLRESS